MMDLLPGDFVFDKDGDLGVVSVPDEDWTDTTYKAEFFKAAKGFEVYVTEYERHQSRFSIRSKVTKVQSVRRPGIYPVECPECNAVFILWEQTQDYLCPDCR